MTPHLANPGRLRANEWKSHPQPEALPLSVANNWVILVADLLVRGVNEEVVNAPKKRAGAHSPSAEAEYRAILAAVLLTPRRRPLAELLASMPDVGRDGDIERREHEAVAADVLA